MSRKEDIDKLNSLLAEVNALAEKLNKEYEESAVQEDTKPDVLAHYKSAFQEDKGSNVYYLDMNSEIKDAYDYGDGLPFSKGDIYASNYYNPYHMYLSEEYAKKAAKMKKFNDMLLAYKWSHDRTYEPDWSDSDTVKYFVYYDTSDETYSADCTCVCDKNTVHRSRMPADHHVRVCIRKDKPVNNCLELKRCPFRSHDFRISVPGTYHGF